MHGNQFLPEVIVEGQIEERAVHVHQDRVHAAPSDDRVG